MFDSDDIINLSQKLSKIPGFSKKTVEKFIYWIFENDQSSVNLLANEIKKIKEKTKFCPNCTSILTENQECKICTDFDRKNTLLVIESLAILNKIEKSGIYFGKYFVFDKKIENEIQYNQSIPEIKKFLDYAQTFDEIILALSPTLKGEIVTNILKQSLKEKGLNVSQIAIGIPLGASVDYIDETTLKFSIKNRQNE
ncbi:toprim domain-containing protein [Mycoplasma sp. 6243]|uniref:toprim domain-containing protein n=1 Tax=Mycoplasma sp. 6243 TaxID=3440865 RepID=UPI003EB9BC69